LSSHIPALLSDEEQSALENKPAEPVNATPTRWRGRLFNRKAAKAIAIAGAIWIVQMFIFVALPWIASGDVLTMVWAVLWFVANTAALANVSIMSKIRVETAYTDRSGHLHLVALFAKDVLLEQEPLRASGHPDQS
jgi:hypothetical protein